MKVFYIRLLVLVSICVGLVGCGGGSSSGADESLAQEREAVECVDFGDGTVINLCDFAIIVVTFGGTSTPVTVPANGTAVDPDSSTFASFGACRAPFTPVSTSSTEFECL